MEYSCPEAFAPDFLENAVLVYGPRKSGTTLLQSLLDGGSQLLMLPGEGKIKFLFEPRVAAPYLLRYALQQNNEDWTFERATTGKAALEKSLAEVQLPGLSLEDTARILDLEKYRAALQTLHAANPNHTYERLSRGDNAAPEYSSAGKEVRDEVGAFASALQAQEYSGDGKNPHFRCWATKEVGGHPEKIVERLRVISPNLKVVFLVRQPQFIVRSIILDRRRKGVRLGFWKIWKECEAAQDIIGDAFVHSLGRDIIVTYEALTRDTKNEMRRIAAALGIAFEERFCAPTMLGATAIVRTSSKETQQVFQTEKAWDDGLQTYQKRAIRLFHSLAPILYRFRGRKFVRYETLLQELKEEPDN